MESSQEHASRLERHREHEREKRQQGAETRESERELEES